MAKYGTGTYTGESGTKYEFIAYSLDTEFKAVGAVYIISKRTPKPEGGGSHEVIYVGQTGDLSERFDDHHKADCFKKNGANCILVHAESNEKTRFQIETDLCRQYSSAPCNG